jgi:hypothetical protein
MDGAGWDMMRSQFWNVYVLVSWTVSAMQSSACQYETTAITVSVYTPGGTDACGGIRP